MKKLKELDKIMRGFDMRVYFDKDADRIENILQPTCNKQTYAIRIGSKIVNREQATKMVCDWLNHGKRASCLLRAFLGLDDEIGRLALPFIHPAKDKTCKAVWIGFSDIYRFLIWLEARADGGEVPVEWDVPNRWNVR